MTRRRCGLMVVIVLSMAGIGQAEEWKQYDSKEGKFGVLMPGKPVTSSRDVPTAAGRLKMHMFFISPQADRVYMVVYNDYPAAVLLASNTAKILDNVRDGNASKGKLKSEKKITLGKEKFPGREVRIEMKAGLYRARIFLVGSRLYQIVALGPKDFVEAKEANKYFESFKASK